MDEYGTESTEEMHFFYDAQSRPAFVEYEGAMYRYIHNLQGDIVAIVDAAGNLVVEYKYDAWGKPIGTTGSLKTTLGEMNPLRYRSYAYSEESGLYYLQSRYYDSLRSRFINGDYLLGYKNICAHNVFSYCSDNPVQFYDPNGNLFVMAVICSIVVIGVAAVLMPNSNEINSDAQRHYARNTYNNANPDYCLKKTTEIGIIEYIQKTYERQPETANMYHRYVTGIQGEEAKYNVKYLSPDGGHYEVIICERPDAEPYIVNDPINMGTYNYASNDNPLPIYAVDHFVRDMVPYYLFGNTREDELGWLKTCLD